MGLVEQIFKDFFSFFLKKISENGSINPVFVLFDKVKTIIFSKNILRGIVFAIQKRL
jgi:hypothetical protein